MTNFIYAFLLVLFANSGFVKSCINATGYGNLDITILSLIILIPFAVALSLNYTISREKFVLFAIFSLFMLSYMFSASYTTSDSYYINKIFALTGLIFSFIFGMLSGLKVRLLLFNLFSYFTVISVTLYFLLMFSNLSTDSLNDFTGNSLVAGEMLGASVLVFYFSNFRFKSILILFSFAVMIALGARGPLLFSLLILFFVMLTQIKKIKFINFVKLILAIAILVAGTSSFNLENSETIVKTFNDGLSRFSLLFSDDKGDSVNSRTYMISKTLTHIENNVMLGTGVGSFGIEIYGKDMRAYPHNVPLEIWFESGFFSFILFILFVMLVSFRLFKNHDYLTLSIFIYLFCNINKSSSLEELRFFFILAGFSISKFKFNTLKNSDTI